MQKKRKHSISRQHVKQNSPLHSKELFHSSLNRDRTDMVLLPADFESTASTNSAMRPVLCRILKKRILQVNIQKYTRTGLIGKPGALFPPVSGRQSFLFLYDFKVLRTCAAYRTYEIFRKAVALIFISAQYTSVLHSCLLIKNRY